MDMRARVVSELLQIAFETDDFSEVLGKHEEAEQILLGIIRDPNCPERRRARNLISLGKIAAYTGRPQDMEKYCFECIALCGDKEPMRKLLAYAYNTLGYGYRLQGELSRALEYYRQSLQIGQIIKDDEVNADALNNIGNVYRYQWRMNEALEYCQKALLSRQKMENKTRLGYSLNTLGMIYRDLARGQKTKTEATIFFQEAYRAFAEDYNERGMALVNIASGVMHRHFGELEEAIQKLRSADRILCDQKNKADRAEALDELALAYLDVGELNQAQKSFDESMRLARECNDNIRIASAMVNQCKLYYMTGDLNRIDATARMLHSQYRRHLPGLTTAKLVIILGDAALKRRNLPKAAFYYLRALVLMIKSTQFRKDGVQAWQNGWRLWRTLKKKQKSNRNFSSTI